MNAVRKESKDHNSRGQTGEVAAGGRWPGAVAAYSKWDRRCDSPTLVAPTSENRRCFELRMTSSATSLTKRNLALAYASPQQAMVQRSGFPRNEQCGVQGHHHRILTICDLWEHELNLSCRLEPLVLQVAPRNR